MANKFQLSSCIGTVYGGRDIVFSKDGNTLLTPVRNRVTLFQLNEHTTRTLPLEGRFNYTTAELSPNGLILLLGNEIGEIDVVSLVSQVQIHCLVLGKGAIDYMKFSPDGNLFSVARGSMVFVYYAPTTHNPSRNFELYRVFKDANARITSISWSFDSKLIATGSDDTMVRVHSLARCSNFRAAALGGQSARIVSVFFQKDSYDLYSVASNAQVALWECSGEPGDFKPVDDGDDEDDAQVPKQEEETSFIKFKRNFKTFLEDVGEGKAAGARVMCADLATNLGLLVTGFSSGAFYVHDMTDCKMVHSFVVSQDTTTVRFNPGGNWIALGCAGQGQLLVWEWSSDNFILKQQGHDGNMRIFSFSPDSRSLVTGADDGKVKLWNTSSAVCFVTFTEHTDAITGIAFTHTGNAVLSASVDGTVRAHDVIRYRNFRTLTSPRPAQFNGVTVDSSDELVASGALDTFTIFLWSLKTGRLLEVLEGHEGPVSGLAFSPGLVGTMLASVSWDKTLRFWNVLESASAADTIELDSEATCVAFRADGKQVAVGTLSAHILKFETKAGNAQGSIEGRKHLSAGRESSDAVTARKNAAMLGFSSLAYSPDGQSLLAGGQSRQFCLYHVQTGILLTQFQLTKNKSLDAMQAFNHKSQLTEFGSLALVEQRSKDPKSEKLPLPGVKRGEMASIRHRPKAFVSCLGFSSNGRSFGVSGSEGLLIYSCDVSKVFEPIEADASITPQTILECLQNEDYERGLVVSLKLNMEEYIRKAVESIPLKSVEIMVRHMTIPMVELLLQFLGIELGKSRHVNLYLIWLELVLKVHYTGLKASPSGKVMQIVHTVEKSINDQLDFMKITHSNDYTLDFIMSQYLLKKDEEED